MSSVVAQCPETGLQHPSELLNIAVTGIGIVTPLGLGCSVNLQRLLAGDSAVRNEIPQGVEDSRAIASARCPDFDLAGLLRFPKALKYMSRPVQLAMRAALEAFEASGLERGQIDPYRLAIYTASGQTGLDYTEFSRALDLAWGSDRKPDFGAIGGMPTRLIDPYFSLRTLGNGGIALLSTEFGAKGPSSNFVHSDTAPALALQAACLDIAEGRSDAALVGGFDSLLYPTALFALSEAGILTDNPGDSGKIVPAEGAAFFILERRAAALDRGVEILAEILGIECSVEPPLRNPEHSSGRSIRKLIRRLPEACQSFHFAVCPGSAPRWKVASALGEVPVANSLTRATGNLGAATAAAELALGLLSARRGFVPAVMTSEESSDGGVVLLDESTAALPAADPTGIFFSRSWSGQIAAIAARACSIETRASSIEERKVLGACAP
jgi:3-oxoacyl-[acyl-carrier-protein] synthase II